MSTSEPWLRIRINMATCITLTLQFVSNVTTNHLNKSNIVSAMSCSQGIRLIPRTKGCKQLPVPIYPEGKTKEWSLQLAVTQLHTPVIWSPAPHVRIVPKVWWVLKKGKEKNLKLNKKSFELKTDFFCRFVSNEQTLWPWNSTILPFTALEPWNNYKLAKN